jgi:hypothetical protein
MNRIEIPITAGYKPARRRMRFGRTRYGGRLIGLVPLPFGLGLTIGCSSLLSVRAWAWARYDFADHEPAQSERWANRVLMSDIQAGTKAAETLEAWKARGRA